MIGWALVGAALAGVVDVTAAEGVACALVVEGDTSRAMCWGEVWPLRGEQGGDIQGPTAAGGPPGLVALETDGYRLVGIDGAGVLWSWRIGSEPQRLREAVASAVLGGHSLCVLSTGGEAACWFEDWDQHQPLSEPRWTHGGAVEVALGNQAWCARSAKGQVTCQAQPYGEERLTGVQASDRAGTGIYLGYSGGCLVRNGAAPMCFGDDEPPSWADRPVRFASDGWTDDRWGTCTIAADGTTQCRFDSEGAEAEVTLPAPAPDELELGQDFACGRWGDEVRCFGEVARLGLVPDPVWRGPVRVPGLSDVVALHVHDYQTCATRRDGSHRCWGPAAGGPPVSVDELPEPEGSCRLAGGRLVGADEWTCRGLDGTVAMAVASAGSTVCAVEREGGVVCGGDGDRGALGSGRLVTGEGHHRGTVVGLTPPIRDLDGRDGRFCVIDADGVACWGGLALAPFRVPVPDPVQVVAGPDGLTCVVTAEGKVWCRVTSGMPYRLESMLGTGRLAAPVDALDDVVELGLGSQHGCARHRDGTVSCFGRPTGWRLGDAGTFVSEPVVIDLGAPGRR